MSIGVLHGQTGGIKLPFRVIGGTTQPSNPKDGDIWVKTSVPIMRTEFANGTWASGGVGLVFLAGTLGGSNPTGANSTVWAINKITGASKYVLKITLTGCKQVQGSTGNWVNLDAYRYYGGTWVQFSREFNATINITYPAGSTCTATDGKTTLTAPNTSGTWACAVPNAGTWKIVSGNYRRFLTIADGDNKTADVTKLFLFDNGDYCNNVTGGWTTKAWKQNAGFSNAEAVAPTINIQNGLMVIAPMKTSGFASGAILPANDFDMGLYTKFCVAVTEFSRPGGEFVPFMKVSDRSIAYWEDAPASLKISESGTKTLSFSFGSGNKAPYVAIRCNNANANCVLKISQMWLE